ncbi:MAG: CopG family transcriptional regulator [Armatimonadetes bacterium]|nr:CopG family transcriptional regulator [Armatimonadota bacterium]
MARTTPVTVRLKPELLAGLEARAGRTRRSRSEVVEELVDLALRTLRYPGITFVEGPAGIRAHLAGTGLDVWEVVMVHRARGGNEKATLRHLPTLNRRRLRLGLAYAREFAGEIKSILDENARAPEAWAGEAVFGNPRPR